MNHYPTVAYICLEFGINDTIKTFAGGLGILAGDTIKTAADLGLPVTGLSLLYKHGYFRQTIDYEGNQQALDETWDYQNILTKVADNIMITIGTTELNVTLWKHSVASESDINQTPEHSIDLYFIDFDNDANPEQWRAVNRRLYPADDATKRLQQIAIGYAALQVYKYCNNNTLPEIIHINESHAAYSIVYLLKTLSADEIKTRFVFTTHTPILAGHEKHALTDIQPILGDDITALDKSLISNGVVNLSDIAMHYSKYTNAVSRKHQYVTQNMFPTYHISSITNGIHTHTWVSNPLKHIFNTYIPDWKTRPENLRNTLNIPIDEIINAHKQSKQELCTYINTNYQQTFDPTICTVGFARRAAHYKRNDLILSDYTRLSDIAHNRGALQIIFSGKAHPSDAAGQEYIKNITQLAKRNTEQLKIIYLPDYGIEISKLLVAGVDIWLNNPVLPLEASGTSGMKAAINGVPSFSTLDGWWAEGHSEGLTGWEIGGGCEGEMCTPIEIQHMYDTLQNTILPLYYTNPDAWANIMKHCIALNGSYFNTKRMLEEYILHAYLK